MILSLEAQFGQSIAIGQISPGPNGLWVISLGYLSYGYLGALLALIAIMLPPLLVLAISAMYHQIEHQRWVSGLMRGISLAVVGLTLTASWSIISRNGSDWKSWLIGTGACGLGLNKRINILVILGLAGLVGYLIYR
jgi:chromate transporter